MTTILLAHGAFLDGEAKTAEALVRYGQDPIACVVDEDAPAPTTHRLPDGHEVRVVPTVEQALEAAPDRLVVGVAPVGGQLPDAWRDDLALALEHGVDVHAGLHDRLADRPRLAEAARAGGAAVVDVRTPPDDEPIWSSRVLDLEATIVLTVGTDCSSGKMTTTVELQRELRDRGVATGVAATGQTGILLGADSGVAVDAVPADFVAGYAEQLVLEAQAAREADVVLVEGQGALSHPAYAGVSVGLLHGASPHACVLCHDAEREHKGAAFHGGRRFPVLAPNEEWALVERLARPVRTPELAGVSVVNGPLPAEHAKRLPEAPAVDVLEDGPGPLADAVEALA